jgi:hypothetical protein
VTAAALVGVALASVAAVDVWPKADAPGLDKPGSPAVARRGDRLEFTGPVPWSGRHVGGDQAGRRLSFGDVPPVEDPAPPSWTHYAPDRVSTHNQRTGTRDYTPAQYERDKRLYWGLFTLLVAFMIAAMFYCVLTLLMAVKRVRQSPRASLALMARCLVPACILGAGVALLRTKAGFDVTLGVFAGVLAINVLTLVIRSRPTPEPTPFDV